jgi:hypothetical protein
LPVVGADQGIEVGGSGVVVVGVDFVAWAEAAQVTGSGV